MCSVQKREQVAGSVRNLGSILEALHRSWLRTGMHVTQIQLERCAHARVTAVNAGSGAMHSPNTPATMHLVTRLNGLIICNDFTTA